MAVGRVRPWNYRDDSSERIPRDHAAILREKKKGGGGKTLHCFDLDTIPTIELNVLYSGLQCYSLLLSLGVGQNLDVIHFLTVA